ncbi:transposase [Micromonospora sp. NPDC001898]|uniref:Transposase n=1 Tax=Micromonospora rubida TaxID=2697657 RepID=A0ABW7SH91_9ACTN
MLDSDRFVDTTPTEAFATLLDGGVYLASISTLYRILRANNQIADRRRQARHPTRARPELTATGPGQVFTWDITKLPGPAKGVYYDAYVMIDIWSRYVVGHHVAATESAEIAHDFIIEVITTHGVPQVVHADRGTSMTSKRVATLLADLHVTRSHSRPRVSNDNPFSEAAFKTVKYHPTFPERFGSLADARTFCDTFFCWYNHEHHHTGIGLHTPPTSTTATPKLNRPYAPTPSTPPGPPTPNASRADPDPKRYTCPTPSGSTHPNPQPINC